MEPQKMENLLAMSGEERFGYFVRKVADFEEVWSLFRDGWATAADDTGTLLAAFWPEEDLASVCAQESWVKYVPKSIPLEAFMHKWIPGMERDGVNVAVFPTPTGKGVVVTASFLGNAIQEELDELQ